ALALAPLGGAAVLAYRRLPEAAALGVLAAVLASDAAGVSEESPAWLAPQLVAAYGLGAHGPARGLAVLAALAAGVAAQGELTAPALLFVSVVLLATWACGRLVGRRTRRARAAEAEAARLAAADPAEIARRVVAEERARLAGDALA